MEAVVLGDLELDLVTGLVIDENRKLAVHRWPGSDGDLVQDMGMGAARILLTGVAVGKEAGHRLEQLRGAMQSGEPLDFAASAAVASNIDQVLVASLRVAQPPGRVNYYEYQIELVRYVAPPAPSAGGFDSAALDQMDAQIDASALSAVQDASAALGTAEGMLSKVDDAMNAAQDAINMIENVADKLEMLQGLDVLRKILGAGGGVVKAAATK